jgi:hypothetical protein
VGRHWSPRPSGHGSELLIDDLTVSAEEGIALLSRPDDRIHTREVAMHALSGKRALIGALTLALAVLTTTPNTAFAGPDPAAKRPTTGKYRLFAGPNGASTVNRLYYGLSNRGEVGVDSTGSSTIGGGYWPKGTGNQYMFNSGLQVAGIIQGTRPNNPWAGDTTGGMFFDASGLRQHGTAITNIFNSTNPADVANWPQGAFVPQGDFSEEVYDPLLRGRVSASQGDNWFLVWEGDPAVNNARPHPLGILAEYRVLGWNYPSGNEDILYLVLTFYNITTTNPAAYAAYRPGIRETLIEYSNRFHQLNNSLFDITLPAEGYTIDPFYAAFSADPDVTSTAQANFSSVNLPFAMGYAYHASFPRAAGWTFSPTIFGAPFFAGSGFVGMKYLKSPTGEGEIQLYSNTTNGGAFPDPNSAVRLYKYLSGTIIPADGVNCNQGDPLLTKICFVAQTQADVRLLQSSTGLALEPGAAGSIVIAYVHAAPVQIPGYVGGTSVTPGDPRILSDAAVLPNGANRVDSIAGFRGYSDANQDGIVQQDEMSVVPGSLYGKSLTAQTIFEAKFLLPFAPEAPDFFLIPGNGQVTVLWRPSESENSGDPYFEVASQATTIPSGGGAPVTNLLYDPNYRRFDVEGYRIYRGRADTPTSLRLIAQYDYAGTTFRDYRGQVADPAIGNRCAPELGVTTTCNNFFSPIVPGQAATLFRTYNLTGDFVQVRAGDRTLLGSGEVINLVADTAVTGQGTGFPTLSNTGVPFVFVDNEVRNGLTYFYAVTAFDLNSVTSTGAGNTALESSRTTKRVSPRAAAGNYVNDGTATVDGIHGRNGRLTDDVAPTIDPATGKFSKKALPADGFTATMAGLVREVVRGSGEISIRIDSLRLGDPEGGAAHTYFYGVGDDNGRTTVSLSVTPSITQGSTNAATGWSGGSAVPELAAAYGGGDGFRAATGNISVTMPGNYFTTVYGRGCVNSATGAYPQFGPTTRSCSYNGPRWFAGDNETKDHPNAGNYASFNGGAAATNAANAYDLELNNAGELPGVRKIYQILSYENIGTGVRRAESVLSGAQTAGDFRVYWGAGGKVDSVIDLTHDVAVPFNGTVAGTWGILNQSGATNGIGYDQRPTVLTLTDLACVPGLKTNAGYQSQYPCPAASSYELSETAVPGPVAFHRNSQADARTRAVAANNGFAMYLKGYAFLFELEGGQLPAAGTEWTMRSYTGGIWGGQGNAGNFGDYVFTPVVRQFAAVGSSIVVKYDVNNEIQASSQETLAKVHTVPDPYYVTSAYEATTTNKQIKFVNLPAVATIRIYSVSGVLVRVLKAETTSFSGEVTWDVRNRNNQFVASGVYFYHVTAENGESTVGRMTIVNYAN